MSVRGSSASVPTTEPTRYALAVAAGVTALSAVLRAIAMRGEAQVSSDSFYYLRTALYLENHWPQRLGSNWPYGYPFLISLLSRSGLHVYYAARTISWISLFALTFMFVRDLAANGVPRGRVFGFALCLATLPRVFRLSGAVLSDVTFAALVFCLLVALQRLPRPGWLMIAMLANVALLCVRYIGVAFVALPVVWLVLSWKTLSARMRFGASLGIAAMAAVNAALLWTNVRATGHLSAVDRGSDGTVLGHVSNYGWSIPGMLLSEPKAIADRLPSWLAFGIGLALALGLLALCGHALRRSSSARTRWYGFAVVYYSAALIAARSLGSFNDLNSGRFLFPVLLPLFALLAELSYPRWLGRAACAAAVVIALATAAREPSAQTHGRVGAAAELLEPRTGPSSVIQVSGYATSLAATIQGDLRMYRPGDPLPTDADYVVIASQSVDREGSRYEYDPRWHDVEQALIAQGWAFVLQDDHVHVLQPPVPRSGVRAPASSERRSGSAARPSEMSRTPGALME
jgi:hypothetical protein